MFKEFKSAAENKQEAKIKALHCDNGGEYTSYQFKEFAVENGIERQSTVPYNPQQNCSAEHSNLTLIDRIRCILIQSGMPKYLWADVAVRACHIRNKCPTKTLMDKAPEKVWTGRDVKYDYLKPIGCQAWNVENDMDSKASACIFIGYPPGIRNVMFNEKVFPLTIASKKEKQDEPH